MSEKNALLDKLNTLSEEIKTMKANTSQQQSTKKDEIITTESKSIVKEEENQQEKAKQLLEEIYKLQNNGVFRLELLAQLADLNNTLKVLLSTILKLSGEK